MRGTDIAVFTKVAQDGKLVSFGAPQGPCFRFAPLFDLIYPPAVGLFVDLVLNSFVFLESFRGVLCPVALHGSRAPSPSAPPSGGATWHCDHHGVLAHV